MDHKKELEEDVKIAIEYYKEWANGAKRIKELLDFEDRSVMIGGRDGPIKGTERGIVVSESVALHDIPDILYRFEDALIELVSKWTELVEEIENYQKKVDLEKEDKIQELLKSKKKTIELAKDILDWMEDHFAPEKGVDVLKELEDPPFEKLKKLAKRLTQGNRKKIVAVIRMEI